ncbi:hypothetical protein ACOI1C_19150 [Bacillus sp. DJP31]|uniref:hypothetical protein n=1 Tax=Bacillus sp. DJP31 TaxID=3409789 RepID=UPI003BB7F876
MGVKVVIKTHLVMTYLSLRNLKIYYFIPIFFMYLVIPALFFSEIAITGVGDILHLRVVETTQKILPLFSVWWIIFILREYIEGEGNEVLYVYEDLKRTKLLDILIVFIIYSLKITPLFILFSFFLDDMIFELLRVMIQCFFYSSLAYCLIYLTKSSAITFMFIMVYNFLVTYLNSSFVSKVSIFSNVSMSIDLFHEKYIYVFLLGLVILLIGMIMNKYFYR